jgi:hypothetical protein
MLPLGAANRGGAACSSSELSGCRRFRGSGSAAAAAAPRRIRRASAGALAAAPRCRATRRAVVRCAATRDAPPEDGCVPCRALPRRCVAHEALRAPLQRATRAETRIR